VVADVVLVGVVSSSVLPAVTCQTSAGYGSLPPDLQASSRPQRPVFLILGRVSRTHISCPELGSRFMAARRGPTDASRATRVGPAGPLRNGAWRRGAAGETLRNGAYPLDSCFLNA
jgi:hypothetical protein